MPTTDPIRGRADRRTRRILVRAGEELRAARTGAGLSSRTVGRTVGISHTQLLRIERAGAPHVDIGVLSRVAATLGYEISIGVHPVGPPVRDRAHLDLLERLRSRLHPALEWATEVPVPQVGDLRAADATIDGHAWGAIVEAETRLGDVQATERRITTKARDLGIARVVLLVADTRHNRRVIAETPELRRRFPVATRAALLALGRGADPGEDALVVL